MNDALHAAVRSELDALREAATYKTFNVLASPQGPVVEMEGRGEVVIPANTFIATVGGPMISKRRWPSSS